MKAARLGLDSLRRILLEVLGFRALVSKDADMNLVCLLSLAFLADAPPPARLLDISHIRAVYGPVQPVVGRLFSAAR
jgi:hypothetical protein